MSDPRTPETWFRRTFSFPNPVNEKAARVVAGGVLTLAITTLVLSLAVSESWLWLCAPIAFGFLARVLTGPSLSPLGQLATKVIAPRLGEAKLVAGPPKRFAQSIGLVVTTSATICVALGASLAAQILLGLMIIAAGLESIFAVCIGCILFAQLMKAGLIPEEICEECNNITLREPVNA